MTEWTSKKRQIPLHWSLGGASVVFFVRLPPAMGKEPRYNTNVIPIAVAGPIENKHTMIISHSC